ncbi:MAG: hypothetical protein HZY79_01425 [Rhodoblastus sp.]|nr:MAG: hypothetical protein HZY79_01425 [Rhodoblastus sp.]
MRRFQRRLALLGDDVAGVDRLLLLIEPFEPVGVDLDRIARFAAGQQTAAALRLRGSGWRGPRLPGLASPGLASPGLASPGFVAPGRAF